jgi:hypothetical protein
MRLRLFTVIGLLLVVGVVVIKPISAQSVPTPTPFVPPFGPVVDPPTLTPLVVFVTATPEATPTPAPTATPTLPPLPTLNADLMGIQAYANVEIHVWQLMVDLAQFMGLRWIKTQVNWREMEPERGEFTQVFSVIRDNLIYAGRRGFKIMISIVNAPDWARPPEARGKLEGPPSDPNAYAAFIGTLLDNWGTSYINAIEIWNEPNLIREWTGMPMSGAVYKRYFDAAYRAIRQRSRDIVVLTAGLAPAGDTPDGSVNDRRWLRELYRAGLPIDDPNLGIGIHPYGWANPPDARCCANPSQGWDNQRFFFFLDNIEDYRNIMLEFGHVNGKLWATEFGWASFENLRYRDHVAGPLAIPPAEPGLGWMNRLSEIQQAQYIMRAFELAQSEPLASFMGPMILWNLNFASLGGYVNDGVPSRPEAGFSVLNSDWAVRPVYRYLSQSPRR